VMGRHPKPFTDPDLRAGVGNSITYIERAGDVS
jgi:hypothetical protein